MKINEKILIAILLTTFFYNSVIAQTKKNTDVIFLKTGSVIYGKISEQEKGKTRIESLSSNIWVFENTEIARMKFDTLLIIKSRKTSILQKDRGFYFGTNIGLSTNFRNSFTSSSSSSLQADFGYMLNPYFRVGTGLGVERFNIAVVPVFLNLKVLLNKNRFSPLLNVKVGYSFPIQDSQEFILDYMYSSSFYYYEQKAFGGMNFEISPGWKYQLSNAAEIDMSVGYRYQKISIEETGTDYYSKTDYEYNRVEFRLGITFF